jgi:hypothetical protein
MMDLPLTNANAVLDRLDALGPRIDDALRNATGRILDRARSRIDGKLSGAALKSRSGALRASLAASLNSSGGPGGSIGVATPYGAFQEYGFHGSESVRAHLRSQSQAFGRTTKPKEVAVRAHARQVDYPGHSYLRSALAEIAPDIRGEMAAALNAVLAL